MDCRGLRIGKNLVQHVRKKRREVKIGRDVEADIGLQSVVIRAEGELLGLAWYPT